MRLRVEPELGALVSSLCWIEGGRDVDLLHSPADRPVDANGIHRFGCWPLVPFANRCQHGRLLVGSDVCQLPINDPDRDRTMHGCGWQRPWAVASQTASSLRLALRCEDFGPYRFEAVIDLGLSGRAASFSIAVTNLGVLPLPFGIGFHPWFVCRRDTSIEVPSERHIAFEPGFKAVGICDVEGESDFRTSQTLWRDAEIAVNFLQCSGPAILSYPGSHRLRIVFDDIFAAPLLWRPPNSGYVCFEPQSHALGAPEGGMAAKIAPLRMLAPQDALQGKMVLTTEKSA